MAHVMRQGTRAPGAFASRPPAARLPTRRVVAVRPSRKQVQARAFFNFLAPKAPSKATVDPRAEELVDDLIDLCSRTDAGAKASPAVKEQIAELVGGM